MDIELGQIWTRKRDGEEVLIMRIADIYVLFQKASKYMDALEPERFFNEFVYLVGMERESYE